MTRHVTPFTVRLAADQSEVKAAQALRHKVFVEELGATGGRLSDPVAGLEADRFDPFCEHLLLIDPLRDDMVVGTTRLMSQEGATSAGGFAAAEEFDLEPLCRSGARLLEVGRTCLHPDYRGGAAMHRIWLGLAAVVEERSVGLLFGLASFSGVETSSIAQALSCLHHHYLAPQSVRPRSRSPIPMDLIPADRVDRRAAMLATPALLKAYLRFGGRVGEGAFLDPAFGCLDVCMILDTASLPARSGALFGLGRL